MNPREQLAIADSRTKSGDLDGAIEVYRGVARYYRDQNFPLKAFALYKQMLGLAPSREDLRAEHAEIAKLLGIEV